MKRDGTLKRVYQDKAAAEEFLLASGYAVHGHTAYQCGICNRWHVGHKHEEEGEK